MDTETTDSDSKIARSVQGEGEAAAVWVDRSKLKPWDKNPRKRDSQPVQRVADSIKRFGFGAPILARQADGEVIAGHTRLLAAEALGLERVPVRFVDLDPADAHLLALADNRIGEAAEWDEPALFDILSDYSLDDAGLAGWTEEDLGAFGETGMPDLGEGEPEFQQMSFVVPSSKVEEIKATLAKYPGERPGDQLVSLVESVRG